MLLFLIIILVCLLFMIFGLHIVLVFSSIFLFFTFVAIELIFCADFASLSASLLTHLLSCQAIESVKLLICLLKCLLLCHVIFSKSLFDN
jgi:hypothetical protein